MAENLIISNFKKKLIQFFALNCLLFLFSLSYMDQAFARYGITFGVGRNTNMNAYRISLQKTSNLFVSLPCQHSLTSYWELSLNQIHGLQRKCCGCSKDDINNNGCTNKVSNGAIAHYFRFTRNYDCFFADPYLEGGVGAGFFDKNKICERRLGSKALFEIKAGAGISFGCYREYDISYKYLHYSNAGMGEFNDAINLHFIVFNYWF